MIPTDLTDILDTIAAAYPAAMASPDRLQAWQWSLQPLEMRLVADGLRKWRSTHTEAPTLPQFLALLDGLAATRHRQPLPAQDAPMPAHEVQGLLKALYAKFDADAARLAREQAQRRRGGKQAVRVPASPMEED